MWRRLCIDVENDGTVVGASVEFWSDRDGNRELVMVLEDTFWADLPLPELVLKLQADGWRQPPLWGVDGH